MSNGSDGHIHTHLLTGMYMTLPAKARKYNRFRTTSVDGCATTNRLAPDGTDYDPEVVHNMSIANLHGEFCTAISTTDAIGLLDLDATNLFRVQGNE